MLLQLKRSVEIFVHLLKLTLKPVFEGVVIETAPIFFVHMTKVTKSELNVPYQYILFRFLQMYTIL